MINSNKFVCKDFLVEAPDGLPPPGGAMSEMCLDLPQSAGMKAPSDDGLVLIRT